MFMTFSMGFLSSMLFEYSQSYSLECLRVSAPFGLAQARKRGEMGDVLCRLENARQVG